MSDGWNQPGAGPREWTDGSCVLKRDTGTLPEQVSGPSQTYVNMSFVLGLNPFDEFLKIILVEKIKQFVQQ